MFHPHQSETREDIREYVAQLQLHMALQARNLVPSLTNTRDSREKLLQDTQATIEKIVSRHFYLTDFTTLSDQNRKDAMQSLLSK